MQRYQTADKQKDVMALQAQVDFFLYEGLAFRIADSHALRAWLNCVRNGASAVASRKQMTEMALSRAEGVRAAVVQRLQQAAGVAVGIDGWTNVRHDKVINLCPVAGGVAYYWDSVVLRGMGTAAAQAPGIQLSLLSIISSGVRVVAIVTDNEAVNTALHRLLLLDFPFLLHIPCAAHTLQLCVRAAMSLQPVKTVVDATVALLLLFKANKELRVNVKQQQALLRPGAVPLQICHVCDTRWNSFLYAADRLLKLKQCIIPFTESIILLFNKKGKRRGGQQPAQPQQLLSPDSYGESAFWRPLLELVCFLRPYQAATDIVQSDGANLASVHHQFEQLMEGADSLRVPSALTCLRVPVMDIIHTHWQLHVIIEAIVSASLFSFDVRYDSFSAEQKGAGKNWFLDWSAELCLYYGLSESDGREGVELALTWQYSDFLRRTGAFARLSHDAALFTRGTRCDAQRVWGLYTDTARELTVCAIALLSLTASEAAVERSFSRQGLVHSKVRNRLSDNSVHLQMFFSFNQRALQHEQRPDRGETEELPDEDEPAGRGTALLSMYRRDEEIVAAQEEKEDEAAGQQAEEHDGSGKAEAKDSDAEEDREAQDDADDDAAGEGRGSSTLPLTPKQRLEQFIMCYVADKHISKGYCFTAPRQGLLQAALMHADIHDTVDTVIKLIKRHVGAELGGTAAAYIQ